MWGERSLWEELGTEQPWQGGQGNLFPRTKAMAVVGCGSCKGAGSPTITFGQPPEIHLCTGHSYLPSALYLSGDPVQGLQHLPREEQYAPQGHHWAKTGNGERPALTQLSNSFTYSHVIAQARREEVALWKTRLSICPLS